ncbi:MAG TPA: hypothetical protein VLB67_14240, partial [Acidimicrobiia bacterium]|nr:hypothetical protein [Acidimicrobiia bacterium]
MTTDRRSVAERSSRLVAIGVVVAAGLLLLDLFQGVTYTAVVSIGLLASAVLWRLVGRGSTLAWWRPDGPDLLAVGVLYLALVTAIRVAFVGFTTESMAGLFIGFAVVGLLLLGVTAPVVYTVVWRSRPLRALGVGLHEWRPTVVLALVFATVQFTMTLWGYDLPQAVDWVPL